MKKYSVLIICLICLALSGCREYGEKRIVKLITIDANNISLHYYDYSADKPSYLVEKCENKGIENTLTELLSQNEYDLKLCKYAVCDSNTVLYKAGELYDALIKTKFSPDIIILQGDTTTESEKVVNISGKNYPIYNYYAENGRITGIIENLDDTEKNIIIDSTYYKTLDEKQSFIFDVLTNTVRKGRFAFEKGGKLFSADIEGINTFYSVNDEALNINICAALKSFKGMNAGEESKAEMKKLLREEWTQNVELLLGDKKITDKFNVLWYGKIENFNGVKVNVNIS